MVDDDYELMPHSAVKTMKADFEDLKKTIVSKVENAAPSKELLGSMDNLSQSMNGMLNLFKTASDEMKLQDREEETIGKKLNPLMQKLDTLIDQNEKIAKGMVAIADMMKELPANVEKEVEDLMPKRKAPRIAPKVSETSADRIINDAKPDEHLMPSHPGELPPIGGPAPGPLPGGPMGSPSMGGPMGPPPPGGLPPLGPAPGAPKDAEKKKGILGLFKK